VGKIIEEVKNSRLIKHLSKDLSREEHEDFNSWLEKTIGAVDNLTSLIHNLGATDDSAETLASTLNHILSEEGVKEVNEWLEKN